MEGWIGIADFSDGEQLKLRWLLRNANENGIVAQGVAVKFGREWRINERKLPRFLQKLTLETLGKEAA